MFNFMPRCSTVLEYLLQQHLPKKLLGFGVPLIKNLQMWTMWTPKNCYISRFPFCHGGTPLHHPVVMDDHDLVFKLCFWESDGIPPFFVDPHLELRLFFIAKKTNRESPLSRGDGARATIDLHICFMMCPGGVRRSPVKVPQIIWVCLKIGYIPNEIAIFHHFS